MATDLAELQSKLWEAADQLRANSSLRSSEYSTPVLGLIFLRYADDRFVAVAEELGGGSGRFTPGPESYIAKGAVYLRTRPGSNILSSFQRGPTWARPSTTL